MAAQTTAWVNFNGKDVGVKISIEGIEKSLNKMQRNGKKDIDSLSASFKNLKSQISSMSGSMGSLPLIGGLGAAGIFAGGKTAVEKFANRESQETSIKFLSKTEQEGKSNLAFLRNLSKEYGVSFSGMLDGYKQLKANMNMMDIAPEEQNNKFKKISAAIRVMGLDAQASSSVFYAFSQMMSKGSIQAQELKLQLANAYPSAVPSLAKSMGVSIKDLNKMLEAGAISWKKYGDNFIDFMYNDVKKGIPNAVNTVSAGIARISNTFENAWVGIGDAIAKSGALDVISQMGKELEVWVSANKEMIASSIKGGVDFVKKGFEWAVAHKAEIGTFIEQAAKLFALIKGADLLMSFTNPLNKAAIAMGAIGLAIWQAVEALNAAKILEKNKKDANAPTSMNSGASAWAGIQNVGIGAVKLYYSPWEGLNQMGTGLVQTAASIPQYGLEQYDYWTRKKGEAPGKSYNWAKGIGEYTFAHEKTYSDVGQYRQDIPTYNQSVPDFLPSQYGLKSQRDTADYSQFAEKFAEATAKAMENWKVLVDSGESRLKVVTASGTPVTPVPIYIANTANQPQ